MHENIMGYIMENLTAFLFFEKTLSVQILLGVQLGFEIQPPSKVPGDHLVENRGRYAGTKIG